MRVAMNIKNNKGGKMFKEELKLNLVDNIMSYLKYELLLKLEEKSDSFLIFNNILDLMKVMNHILTRIR